MKINKKVVWIVLVICLLVIVGYFSLSFLKESRIKAKEANNPVPAPTDSWIKFIPEKGDFTVSFPQTPGVQNVTLDQVMPSTKTTLNTYQYLWQGANSDDYSVVENLYSANLTASPQELVEYYYKVTLDQLSSSGYKSVSKQNILYKNLYPAIDFEVNGPLHSKGRIIVTNQNTFYILIHDYYTVNDASYNYFLNSFELK